MALIIYVYEFPGKPDQLHLAAELTKIPKSSNDPYRNYISYYAYKGSETEEKELEQVRLAQRFGDVGGSGACYMFQTPYSIKGFGAAAHSHDKATLKLKKAILIPTKQDGAESPFDEMKIAESWKEARSWTLENGETYSPKEMYKQKNLQFKVPLRFSLQARHCGTLIHNILDEKELHTERKESSEKKGWLLESLSETAKKAQDCGIRISAENKEGLVKYNELEQEYKEYRQTKSFWQSDSPEMATVKKLLGQYKNFDFVPIPDSISKCKRIELADNKLSPPESAGH